MELGSPPEMVRATRCTLDSEPRSAAQRRSMLKWNRLVIQTRSTSGPRRVTAATTTRHHCGTVHAKWSGTPTWTTTAIGSQIRTMGMCGIRESPQDGPRITMDIGHGLIRGDGLGSTMPAGDTRHFITVAGSRSADAGDGFLDLVKSDRFTLPRWSRSWGGLASESAAMSRGFLWARAKFTCRRILSVVDM